MNNRLLALVVSSTLVVSPSIVRASVCDGWGGGNCSDAHFSRSSSGGTSGGGGDVVLFDGHRTQHAIEMIKECGNNAICGMFRAMIVIPMGLFFDAPVYAVKGIGYGFYYTGVGIGKGFSAAGRGISSSLQASRRRREQKQWEARQPVSCSDGAGAASFGPDGFDAYRAWEKCKKDILKRQHALTKNDSSNKQNEKWCKGHIPLSFGSNTNNWLERCNSGGTTTFNPPQPAPVAQAPASQAPGPSPAVVSPPAPVGVTAPSHIQLPASIAGLPSAGGVPSAGATDETVKAGGGAGFDGRGAMAGAGTQNGPPAATGATIATPDSNPADPAAPHNAAPQLQPKAASPGAVTSPQLQSLPEASASNSTSASGSSHSPLAQATGTPSATSEEATANATTSAGPVAIASAAGTSGSNSISPGAREVSSANVLAAPVASVAVGVLKTSSAKALQTGRKAADCALRPMFAALKDPAFAAAVRMELRKVFAELKSEPASGKADSQKVYAISRDKMVHAKDGDRQAVLKLGVQRFEDSGELHIDAQFALTKTGEDSIEGQTVVLIAPDGTVKDSAMTADVERCLAPS